MMPFRVVIPVAPATKALPRMELGPGLRAALSLAFAQDTIAAAKVIRRVSEVVVVTSDTRLSEVVAASRVRVIKSGEGHDLLEVLAEVRGQLEAEGSAQPTAVLAGDLPALLPHELDEALRSTVGKNQVLARDLGAGTPTLIASNGDFPDEALWAPAPSQHRWRENRDRLLPGLLCDVDTVEGLRVAAYLGVGTATASVLRSVSLPREAWGVA